MPSIRTYNVKLTPAKVSPDIGTGFKGFSCMLFDPRAVTRKVAAASLPDLERQVRDLCRAFGETVAVWVSLPRGERKPSGFDAWCKGIECIEFVADPERVAA